VLHLANAARTADRRADSFVWKEKKINVVSPADKEACRGGKNIYVHHHDKEETRDSRDQGEGEKEKEGARAG